MKELLTLAAAILGFCHALIGLATPAAHATVTWDFAATSCSSVSTFPAGCDPNATYPFPLAELTLPGPDSSGTVQGTGWALGIPPSPPTFTGDGNNYSFTLDANGIPVTVSSADPFGPMNGLVNTVDTYFIAWEEVAGVLEHVGINMITFSDGFQAGTTGGTLSADNQLGPCIFATCQITGFWQSDLPVPVFAGTPGKANCHGQSVSAIAQQYGGLSGAAAALHYSSVSALQDAISVYCSGSSSMMAADFTDPDPPGTDPIPEPASIALFSTSLFGLGPAVWGRRRISARRVTAAG